MISLSSLSHAPLEPDADLIAHLAASGRPAIIHYTADDGRTELSGRVAVNWATKTTHLVDSYGIAAPDAIFVDVPVTWRSLVLALGVAWCDLACAADADDADAILTDRPADYLAAAAELFVTHAESADASVVHVDEEVLSHADQALLPVPEIIRHAVTDQPAPSGVDIRSAGVVIRSHQLRLDAGLWWVIIDAWRRSKPVVLVDAADDAQLQRIIETERLGSAL